MPQKQRFNSKSLINIAVSAPVQDKDFSPPKAA